MKITQAGILRFFNDDLGIDTTELDEDSLLFSTGIIDSFDLVSVMAYLEDESGIRISPADVNLANLDSIRRMLDFVERSTARLQD